MLQFDRWVALVQGAVIAPLPQNCDLEGSLRKALKECERLLSEGDFDDRRRDAVKRKLVATLLVNTKPMKNTSIRRMLPYRNVANLFCIDLDPVMRVLAEHHLVKYLLEAILYFPEDALIKLLGRTRHLATDDHLDTALKLAVIYRRRTSTTNQAAMEFKINLPARDLPVGDRLTANLLLVLQATSGSQEACRARVKVRSDEAMTSFYGEYCLLSPETFASAPIEELALLEKSARQSLTVDHWIGLHEVDTQDIFNNRFVEFWPVGDFGPLSMQQLVAHYAHECVDALESADCATIQGLKEYHAELKSFSKRFVKEETLDMGNMSLGDLVNETEAASEDWKKEAFLARICQWEIFSEIAADAKVLGCLAQNPALAAKHARYLHRESFLNQDSGQHLVDTLAVLFSHCTLDEQKALVSWRLEAAGLGPAFQSRVFVDSAVQFLNRISIVSEGVQYDEAHFLSLIMESPLAAMKMFVFDACENEGKVDVATELLEAMPDRIFASTGDQPSCLCDEFRRYANTLEEEDEATRKKWERLCELAKQLGSKRPEFRLQLVAAYSEMVLEKRGQTLAIEFVHELFSPDLLDGSANEDYALMLVAIHCVLLTSAWVPASAKQRALDMVLKCASSRKECRALALKATSGTTMQFYLRQSSEARSLLEWIHSSHGDQTVRELQLGEFYASETELVARLDESLPHLFPEETKTMFKMGFPGFDSPMAKVSVVLKCLEVLIQVAEETPNCVNVVIRALIDYCNRAAGLGELSMTNWKHFAGVASGLLYLSDDPTLLDAVGGLVSRLLEIVLEMQFNDKTNAAAGVTRECLELLVHAPPFEAKSLLLKKMEFLVADESEE